MTTGEENNSNNNFDYESILHHTTSGDRVQKSGSTSNASPTSSNANNPHGLNPRSCVTCRRRKVKCDKKHPCTNCSKAHIECIFPAPGRAPRKPRKPQDGELMERLRRLEGVVQTLGVSVQDIEEGSEDEEGEGNNGKQETEEEMLRRKIDEVKELKRKKWQKLDKDTSVQGIESRFGRLVVDEGRSRYINPSFWASLSDEVEDIKGILNEESEDELNFPSPDSSNNMSNMHGYIFAHSSKSVDMLALHPPAEHIPLYWEVFKERVDPLVKVLHIPTIEPTILESRHRLDQIHRGLEVLLFAVYYGAVTSLTNDQARQTFGEDKLELVMRYKFGCEQALARADFLQTDEMVVLQAFVTFLICLRRNDDARIIWTLTGLVVRMAQTLGIHRDGGHYDLAPFDIEMRRRLWWQICILDSRASEDHGCDPTITEQSFDTQMPLNVDDIDISPAMTSFPDPKLGCTEMTFGLIRFEIVAILRRIQYVPPGPKQCQQFFATVPLEKKEEWISECHARIEERYLKHCDMSVPLYWVIATVARLIMSKMWLMIYHPFQRQDGGNSLPQETKDKLFLTSLENIEYSLLLENEERTKKWGWLFQTYVQWHAIAFLLNELCIRTQGEYVERAWRAVEIVTNRRWGAEYANNRLKSHLWRPLRRLMNKAKAARTKELEKEAVQQTAAHGLPGLSREHAQNPGMELQFAAPYGLDINNLSGSASPQDFLAQPTGLTPIPTNFNISNMPSGIAKGTPQSTADSSSNAASGNGITATPPTANQSPNPNATFPRLGPLPTTTVAPMTTIASTDMSHGFGNMPDFNTFDWSQLNDPSLQISPTGTGQGDEIMAETVDWANWDDMVAQFGGIDQQSGNGENFVSGQMPGQMPGPGQPGGFGAGISSPNYWY